MKIAIMQPYFLPYIGYFQLISHVDEFIVYDKIKYTKKGWINRNRLLLNSGEELFSINLEKSSDFTDVIDKRISPVFSREKLLNKIHQNYRYEDFYKENIAVFEEIISFESNNLFYYIFNSIKKLNLHLNINTSLRISSSIDADSTLKNVDRVINICHRCGATTYVNPPGGRDLYESNVFEKVGVKLSFFQPTIELYSQPSPNFVTNLSILDVLMRAGKEFVMRSQG
jgi:hypothetical protein